MEAPTWLRHTLEEIIGQIRRLLDVSGCAFQVVDFEEGMIRPAAAWFASDEARDSMTPVLERPYDRERPGVTEAAIERGDALLLQRFEDWEGASALRERLEAELEPEVARRGLGLVSQLVVHLLPGAHRRGRTLGVLAISSRAPQSLLGAEDLRVVEVFAGLAALALERSELLDREERRGREQRELSEAARAVSASLEPDAVYAAIVEQARRLVAAGKVALRRYELATGDLRTVAAIGFTEEGERTRFRVGEGMIGQVARTGESYVSDPADADRWVRTFIEREGIGSFVHVPIALGPRLFGILTASHEQAGYYGPDELARLEALAPPAAGAIANALDFHRERRIAAALTRGFIPHGANDIPGFELGLVYEPAGHDAGGGDIFGVWTMPSGALAVLVGDVTGKGLEVAALSAMVRFFVEARSWDSERPGRDPGSDRPPARGPAAERQLRHRLHGRHRRRDAALGQRRPRTARAPAPGRRRGAQGHRRAAGRRGRCALPEHETPFGPGDVLFASTDGLIEARREGSFFGERRLPIVLAEHGRTLAPDKLVALVYREVEAWAPRLDDDVVLLALRPCW